MSWAELSHGDGHVLVEYENGTRLNIRYDHLIEMNDPERSPQAGYFSPTMQPVSTRYKFAPGAILSAHKHDAATLHDILVQKGTIIVQKESGDVEAGAGDRVSIKVGEVHSIIAKTAAVTLHTLVNDALDPA